MAASAAYFLYYGYSYKIAVNGCKFGKNPPYYATILIDNPLVTGVLDV
jgi:hypothetical protein